MYLCPCYFVCLPHNFAVIKKKTHLEIVCLLELLVTNPRPILSNESASQNFCISTSPLKSSGGVERSLTKEIMSKHYTEVKCL